MGSLARHALVVCDFDDLSALQPCINVCGSARIVLRSGTSHGCQRACGLITGQGSLPNATVKSGNHELFRQSGVPELRQSPHRSSTSNKMSAAEQRGTEANHDDTGRY
jgi:hypothetical protein